MSYTLSVHIDGLPPINSATDKHWRAKSETRRHWRSRVWYATRDHRPIEPLKRASVIFWRYSKSRPDYGNLVESFKPVLDALLVSRGTLRRADILVDDSPEYIEEHYRWRKAKSGSIRIEIEEVDALEANVRRFGT